MKQYRRYFPQVRIRSTGFIFVTVSITSLYNGGFKNGNFVVKIYRCFLTVKISKATWLNHRATSTSLLAVVQSEVSSHKATSSPESPSNVSPDTSLPSIWVHFIIEGRKLLFIFIFGSIFFFETVSYKFSNFTSVYMFL